MSKSRDVASQFYTKGKIKVTIGLCVRNEEETIEETIKSIGHQDFSHELMEVIIVNDGSEDNTLAIVLNLVQRMAIHATVFHRKWGGLGSARNVVVDNARGDYIVWVDGGTILPKDHIRKQVEFMDQNPNVGIAKAKCATLGEENMVSILENMQYLAFDSRYEGNVDSFVLGTCGATYRTRAIRDVGGFDRFIRGSGEDLDVEYRMRDAGWLLYRTSAIYYRKHIKTWRSAWHEGVKYGYGGHYLIYRYKERVLERSFISILDGLLNAKMAYTLTRRKIAFLLPFHHALKKLAWLLGFLKGHLDKNKNHSYSYEGAISEPHIVYSKN